MTYTINTTTWRSPNYNSRGGEPIGSIVVHSCEGSLPEPKKSSLPWLCNPTSGVSCHYYVCRDTKIYQLVADTYQAWHAGKAVTAYQNPRSIGIECEHRSGQDWPAAQKDALSWLIKQVIAAHHITVPMIDTHGQIALPGPYDRKVDPSDWPHEDFIAWRDAQFTQPTSYRVMGLPVYQRSDRTGPLWGHLSHDEPVTIDDPNNGHLADGRGFVDVNGLVPQP